MGAGIDGYRRSYRRREADEVLAALKWLAGVYGWDAAWALLPPGLRLLGSWLEGVDGLGPELAAEVTVKVALHWQGA